ncbi:hypothetical protein CVT91_10895 [Candidatus Atribacteria bacterium HGW-Atribacteria-1]|nr:MAG: hypothetical protein CVT91_10895 [Candidatus Atribacteria bacterium HGW-Atribacteria-1]
MRRKLIVVFLGIIIITGVFFTFKSIQNRSSQPPRLTISEIEWDYGQVKPNEKYTHIFTIKNEGDEELIIERARASCGCIKISLSSKNIQPGKSTELKTIFDTTGYDGKVKKEVYITSNDPQEPNRVVNLSLEVEHQTRPVISFSEAEWNFGYISQGEIPTLNWVIENKGDEDLIITKIDTYEHIKHNITFPLNIPPQGKHNTILTYDSTGHELGESREAISIFSNDPRRGSISLRIRGYISEAVKPSITILPPELKLNLTDISKEETMGKFTIENYGKGSLKIVSVKTSADYLVPLYSELEIGSGEKKDLQIILLKDKLIEETKEEIEEYLYLNIAIPIKISK